MAKYYQLRENADSLQSIGVIRVEKGAFPTEKIKEAIISHLDEEIEVVNVEIDEYDGNLVVKIFRLDGEENFITGEQTWLYF